MPSEKRSETITPPGRRLPGIMRGHLLQMIMPLQGRGDTISIAHPEGPYVKMDRRKRRKLDPFGEFGESIEDTALHNPLPHL